MAGFVGRVREWGLLGRALDTAGAGHGCAVLVAGEAGIGKTRFVTEVAATARVAGFEVLIGRSMDLLGAELPYQPFVEALRPQGRFLWQEARSQLAIFEQTLALLADRAQAMPLLLILEDLHWADASTLDLLVYLAHQVHDRPIVLLATYRADEPHDRIRRLAERAGTVTAIELGPLADDELIALLDAHGETHGEVPAGLTGAIVARAEGNPFFAEELLAAAGDGNLPPVLSNLLLRRMSKLDGQTRAVLRLAAAAGRDVAYPVLRATAQLAEAELRESLRQAVEHGLLSASLSDGTFRFRHALLAEAVYGTILPGEREDLHARLAEELSRGGAATPAELARHWAIAGRATEALLASVEAADRAEAVFGLTEAHAHLERALSLWDTVPDAETLTKRDLAVLCARAAELASQVGEAPRAIELARRAIELTDVDDPHRVALLRVRHGEYLYEIGEDDAALAELEYAVRTVPAEPPSPECAYVLASLSGGLMVAWRHRDSLPVCLQALAMARAVGAGDAEVRALTVLGVDLAYAGQTEDGLAYIRQSLELAEEIGDYWGLDRAYVNLTDALNMMSRFEESARIGQAGLDLLRRCGIESAALAVNTTEALLAIGEWADADRVSATALRSIAGSFRDMLHLLRSDLELARGNVDAAREHLRVALATAATRQARGQGLYDIAVAELALCEGRWADADEAVRNAIALVRSEHASFALVRYCAKGLRAQAELTARAHRDPGAVRGSADGLIALARSAAGPHTTGWLALAEAEYARTPQLWSAAATAWDRVGRLPLAAYCRWREAEALAGGSRAAAAQPLRQAHAVAVRIGAAPLVRDIELLAQRTRISLVSPPAEPARAAQTALGLTAREAEVLGLLAQGYTNREIAAALFISVKTAGIHVSSILRKLGVPNRLEAAAIAQRLAYAS